MSLEQEGSEDRADDDTEEDDAVDAEDMEDDDEEDETARIWLNLLEDILNGFE